MSRRAAWVAIAFLIGVISCCQAIEIPDALEFAAGRADTAWFGGNISKKKSEAAGVIIASGAICETSFDNQRFCTQSYLPSQQIILRGVFQYFRDPKRGGPRTRRDRVNYDTVFDIRTDIVASHVAWKSGADISANSRRDVVHRERIEIPNYAQRRLPTDVEYFNLVRNWSVFLDRIGELHECRSKPCPIGFNSSIVGVPNAEIHDANAEFQLPPQR